MRQKLVTIEWDSTKKQGTASFKEEWTDEEISDFCLDHFQVFKIDYKRRSAYIADPLVYS